MTRTEALWTIWGSFALSVALGYGAAWLRGWGPRSRWVAVVLSLAVPFGFLLVFVFPRRSH